MICIYLEVEEKKKKTQNSKEGGTFHAHFERVCLEYSQVICVLVLHTRKNGALGVFTA